jgi:beta-N-acetylhexosaminidase
VHSKLVFAAAAVCSIALLPSPNANADTPIEDLVASMSLREKAGQVVMAPISGRSMTSATRDMIHDLRLGGVILFASNYSSASQVRDLNARLQRTAVAASPSNIGMLISVDQEGGVVKRFHDLAPSFGAPEVASLAQARRMGETTGNALRRVGVNLNLAPVADLDRGPTRVMAARSFGRTNSVVRARIDEYLDGLIANGVAGTLKHYPGLGAGDANTDDRRVVVRLNRSELAEDAKPFLVARDRLRVTVMTSNAIYPAYEPGVPGSVSPKLIRQLRARLGSETLVITDSLNAIAWRFGGSTPKACPAAIGAGADIALVTGGYGTTRSCVAKIIEAVRNDRIPMSRLNEAVTHVLRLKRAFGLTPA